ncbi:hypothetical protein [Pararhizobium sp. A13]|uniref:hypothetical protein n=1 Tax=Pararhizobium sp. A13 TaxID=3133975 RepID=UPI00311AE733
MEAGLASSISSRSITLDQCQIAALKRELLLCSGCLLMFWAIGAAASSGFIITAFFVIVAAGQFVRRTTNNILAKLGKRSMLRRYATGLVSLCLFCLVIARACYIATVLVNTELRTPIVPLIAVSIGPMRTSD